MEAFSMKRLSWMVVLLFWIAAPALGQGVYPLDKESLRGLPGVYVNVGSLAREIEAEGLTKEQLRIEIEKRLRKAGIRVFTLDEVSTLISRPILNVEVASHQSPELTKKLSTSLYAVSIEVDLHQAVRLDRLPKHLLMVTTWSDRAIGFATAKDLRTLRDQVGAYVDRFINDYLSVNHK
jgi:hypothetical protein